MRRCCHRELPSGGSLSAHTRNHSVREDRALTTSATGLKRIVSKIIALHMIILLGTYPYMARLCPVSVFRLSASNSI